MFILRKQLLGPDKQSDWASEMVLNPAIIENEGKIHMIFRATGAYPQKRLENKSYPYPIFLGYGVSEDGGETFEFDLTRPALSPKLEYEIENIKIEDINGCQVTNYANGCIEDPRFFTLDGETYITCACRMFPPGPYWVEDNPVQCAPNWHNTELNPYGAAASNNVTVNVLFKVDLKRLEQHDYDKAFTYITHLNNPEFGEDRDIFFFPKRINGKLVMLSRPVKPNLYDGINVEKPSILISYGDGFSDFSSGNLKYEVLASPLFDWEKEKIGASAPPILLDSGKWLLNYHGKRDEEMGYTQSFMILNEKDGEIHVKNRCPERLIYANEDFESPNKFSIPCIFSTGLIDAGDRFIMSYGAADEKIGIMYIDKEELLNTITQYDCMGKKCTNTSKV